MTKMMMMMMMMIIDRSINQSINRCLLTCRLNSKSAYYKASTKHKYNTKTAQIHKQTLNKRTNERKQYYRKRYIKVLGKPLYSEEAQISLFKNVLVQRRICFAEVVIITIIIVIVVICFVQRTPENSWLPLRYCSTGTPETQKCISVVFLSPL
jgi:hypothetical protein